MRKLFIIAAVVAMFLSSCKKDMERNLDNQTVSDTEKSTQKKKKTGLEIKIISAYAPMSIVQVSPTISTQDVLVIKFSIKAIKGDVHINELPIRFGSSVNLENVVSSSKLTMDSNVLDEKSLIGDMVIFDDLDVDIQKDDTEVFTVLIDIKPLTGNYLEGTDLKTSLLSHLINAEDQDGDPIPIRNINFTGFPQIIQLYTHGVHTTLVSSTAVATSNPHSATYTVRLKATAFGSDVFVGQTTTLGMVALNTTGFAWVLEEGNQNTPITISVTSISAVNSPDAPLVGNTFRVNEGTTKNFTVTINVSNVPTTGSYRLRLVQIRSFINSGQTVGAVNQNLIPVSDYRTAPVFFP